MVRPFSLFPSSFVAAALILSVGLAHADDKMTSHEHHHPAGPTDCGDMEVWDYANGMCMPFPMAGMPMRMLMLHGNSFLTQTLAEKPRGANALTLPNMFMADLGSSIGDRQYLNFEFMGTLERWTYPEAGYPELLQIGESQADGTPFIDAQHPHSSPVMGLTLSDTIAFGSHKDHAKVWFAPRGQSTDGPVAFMHRPTGMVNPDAPLGHHIGQDVGHISSTVLGGSVQLAGFGLELSSFNGTEPEPTKVDLPMATPNSYAGRLTYQFNPRIYAMTSAAYVKNPELHDPALDHISRYSASIYSENTFENGWKLQNAFIWGLVNFYDHASALNSFNEEFWLQRNAHSIWGRIEELQRTPEELALNGVNDAHLGRWVTAVTVGYTRSLTTWESAEVGLGGSLTKDFLPTEFQNSYGGNPLSGKIFLQLNGMKMWDI